MSHEGIATRHKGQEDLIARLKEAQNKFGYVPEAAMAELAERLGCRVGELSDYGLEVVSAGVFAGPGAPATPEAQHAVSKYGVDLSGHRSQKLTEQLITSADMIFCMSQSHLAAVGRSDTEKACRLDADGDIPDPIGGGLAVYRKTANYLRQIIRNRLEELVL